MTTANKNEINCKEVFKKFRSEPESSDRRELEEAGLTKIDPA